MKCLAMTLEAGKKRAKGEAKNLKVSPNVQVENNDRFK
jgi:hypothetical protein